MFDYSSIIMIIPKLFQNNFSIISAIGVGTGGQGAMAPKTFKSVFWPHNSMHGLPYSEYTVQGTISVKL